MSACLSWRTVLFLFMKESASPFRAGLMKLRMRRGSKILSPDTFRFSQTQGYFLTFPISGFLKSKSRNSIGSAASEKFQPFDDSSGRPHFPADRLNHTAFRHLGRAFCQERTGRNRNFSCVDSNFYFGYSPRALFSPF